MCLYIELKRKKTFQLIFRGYCKLLHGVGQLQIGCSCQDLQESKNMATRFASGYEQAYERESITAPEDISLQMVS